MNAKQLRKAIDTPEVHDLVNAWLLQKTYAVTTREHVDKVYADVLREIEVLSNGKYRQPVFRILENKDLYMSDDTDTLEKIYAEVDRRLKAANVKPAEMVVDFCPALVAEHELSKIEHLLADTTGKPLGVSSEKLLCSRNGLDNYKKWIELVVSAITNSPKFKLAKIQPK